MTRIRILLVNCLLLFVGFYCTACVLIFKTKKQLRDHRQSYHEMVKSFECYHCPKKYTRNEHLQTHLLSHTANLQFCCEYCGQQFWRESHLKNHYSVHKIDSDKGQCSCAVCGGFFDFHLLKTHMELVQVSIAITLDSEVLPFFPAINMKESINSSVKFVKNDSIKKEI